MREIRNWQNDFQIPHFTYYTLSVLSLFGIEMKSAVNKLKGVFSYSKVCFWFRFQLNNRRIMHDWYKAFHNVKHYRSTLHYKYLSGLTSLLPVTFSLLETFDVFTNLTLGWKTCNTKIKSMCFFPYEWKLKPSVYRANWLN